MIWILFYYNSLPQFPEHCPLISNEIVHRDYFKCNPSNTGHFQYPLFERLAYDDGCHEREVRSFLRKNDPEKYVVLYSRMTNINGTGQNRIVGYLKVGNLYQNENFGFTASDSVLLPWDECIDLPYAGRAVPVSWGHASIKGKVEAIIQDLILRKKDDVSKKYQAETTEVMKVLTDIKLRKEMIATCENCSEKKHCFWGKYPREKKRTILNNFYGEASKTC